MVPETTLSPDAFKYIYKRFDLDRCPHDNNHSVELIPGDSKVYFCSICNKCYGLDDSSSIEDIVYYASYIDGKTCNKCGNNDPSSLEMEFDGETLKIKCKLCDEVTCIEMVDGNSQKRISVGNGSSRKGDQARGIPGLFECLDCQSSKCSTEVSSSGKLQEVKCDDCGATRYFNEAYRKFRESNQNTRRKYGFEGKERKKVDELEEEESFMTKVRDLPWKNIINTGLSIVLFAAELFEGKSPIVNKITKYAGLVKDFLPAIGFEVDNEMDTSRGHNT